MSKQRIMDKKIVAVTGMGAVCSCGYSLEQIWNTLLQENRQLDSNDTLHPKSLLYPYFSAPDIAYNHNKTHTAKDIVLLAEYAVNDALKMVDIEIVDNNFIGVVAGTTSGSSLHFLSSYEKIIYNSNQYVQNSDDLTHYLSSNLAFELAAKYNLNGPTFTISNACTSGTDAIGIGMQMIQQGLCEYVVCGGSDSLSLVPHTGFSRLGVYSKFPCKPFDKERTGLNLGEGAGFVVLESLEHALQRKAKVYGLILAYSSHSDVYHFTSPHPEGKGLEKAINDVLEHTQIEDIAFINAHATSTRENDKVEGQLLAKMFGHTPIWGSKGHTGHTLGAAGALEAIFCLLALNNKICPQTIGFSEMDEEIGLVPTQKNITINKQNAISTSLGFGGGNSALLVSIAVDRYIEANYV